MKSEHNKLVIVIIIATVAIMTSIWITSHAKCFIQFTVFNFYKKLRHVLFGSHSTGEETKIQRD